MRVDITLNQIGQLIQMLGPDAEEDERLLMDSIAGETDAFEVIRKLLEGIERAEGDKAALAKQIDDRSARKARCDIRINTQRAAIAMIMKAAKLTKAPLPEATITLGETAAKLVVNDPDAVPQAYASQKWIPDMAAIKEAFSPGMGDLPNWLRVEPAKPSLTIRRK